ncbi:hypothetical protein [Modicisalibacter radicis]|nr:hypothetical protein [Halomonas sp. EAR18]
MHGWLVHYQLSAAQVPDIGKGIELPEAAGGHVGNELSGEVAMPWLE